MKHNIIHRHPLTSTGAALFLVLLALEAPWWLTVPVAIALGARVAKGWDNRKL
jgi:hypothetical protein